MKTPADRVARLAAAVNDGAAVDWDGERSGEPGLDRTLECLRLVDAIARGYRTVSRSLPAPEGFRTPSAAPPAPAPRAAFEWGPLRVIEAIGAGSFGEVYRAFDPTLEREVALKLWRNAPAGMRDRLLAEARRLARVRHPNVLVVHGADQHGGRAGMWTDLIQGRSLEECLALQGPFGASEAASAAIELCRALAALHAAHLVHRDVKTTNVMREHGGRIVLMDFGAAGELSPDGAVRIEDGAIGTPLTLAPEQLAGAAATPATDLYALGVLVYRLLTGAYPLDAASLEELRELHRRGRRVPLRDRRPDLPAALVDAVEGALAPVARRYPSAGAFEAALAGALRHELRPPAAGARRRRRTPATAAPDARAAAHDLPRTATRFLGNEADLDLCLRLVGPGSWVTVTGPAAHGKTRFALRLAERSRPAFPDGIRFVDLEGLDDPERALARIAETAGIQERADAASAERLAKRLRGARLLLVLDHADLVRAPIARLGELPGSSCPGLGVIVTSSEPIGARDERTFTPRAFAAAPAAEPAADPADPPFVGRAGELAILNEAAESARRRQGGTILIAGEAGLGKSRLMAELRRRCEAIGLLCLGGRCSYRSGRNFEPFLEALEEFSRRFAPLAPGDSPGARGGRSAGLEALLDPRRRGAAPSSREQVWFMLDALLKRIAHHETLVLFLDDLQWADEGTASLLVHVTRNSGGARLLVVGAFRPEEIAAGTPGSAVPDAAGLLASSPRSRTIRLGPLAPEESRALAESMLDRAGRATGVASRIRERAQGNPFFTIEIVRLLARASLAPSEAGPEAPLPPTITEVVLRRVARLSASERDLLDLAAVEGERFHAATLNAITRKPRLAILKALRGLERDHHLVVASDAEHRFSHGLIREVLLREMPAELRCELHGLVADHLVRELGDRPDWAGRIGDQLFEARRFEEARDCFRSAAREACRLFLHERAASFLQRALEALDRGADPAAGRGEILRSLSEVQLLLGRPDRAREAAEEALRCELERGTEPDRAAAREALGEAALAQGDLEAAEACLRAAREHHAGRADARALARCDRKLGAAATRRGDYAGALARLEGALDLLEAPGDEPERARVRVDVGDVLYRRGDFDLALATFEDAVAALRRLDQRHDLARGLNRLGNALFQRGETDRALAQYQEAMALALELDDYQNIARFRANLGNVHLVRGESEPARARYQEALASFESIGDRSGAGQTLMALGNACFVRGDYAGAAGFYRDSVARREELGDRLGWANALDNLGVAEYHLGRLASARAHHQAAFAARTERGDRPGCVESALNLGSLEAVLGDAAAAERLLADAERLAAELGDARKRARALLARACLSLWRGDRSAGAETLRSVNALNLEDPPIRARLLLLQGLSMTPATAGVREALLRRSLEQSDRAGAPGEQATVRLALAEVEHEAGRLDEARSEIAAALALTDGGRIPLLEIQALRLLARLEAADPGGPGAQAVGDRLAERLQAIAAEGEEVTTRPPDREWPPFPLPQ